MLKDEINFQLIEASVPRKRKRPAKILSENKTSAYDDTCNVKTSYRCICFNVINMAVNAISHNNGKSFIGSINQYSKVISHNLLIETSHACTLLLEITLLCYS